MLCRFVPNTKQHSDAQIYKRSTLPVSRTSTPKKHAEFLGPAPALAETINSAAVIS
jgi:hypothetical protein